MTDVLVLNDDESFDVLIRPQLERHGSKGSIEFSAIHLADIENVDIQEIA
jgi:hypothetical protein